MEQSDPTQRETETPAEDATETRAGHGVRTDHPALQPIVIRQGGGFLVRLFAFVGWAGLLLCGLMLAGQYAALSDYFDSTGGITEKYHSRAKFGRDKVAIIRVQGVIASGDGFVKRQIDRVRKDKNVKAIVLRIDSPGGTVTGSDYILHHLKKLREERDLPLVVSMGSVAASGGYYVAMAVGDQEQAIFAEPTTTTGSIGVIIPHYDISGLLARFDIKDDSLATHPRKEMLSITKPMPDDHRELLEAYIDEAFQRFKGIVKDGRPAFQEDDVVLDEIATGEVFTASQALRKGLVDKIGFVEDAIDRAIELADLNEESTRVIQYQRPLSLFDLGLAQSRSDSSTLAEALDLGTPRPYYLWTSFPLLISSDAR
jgi:protease-4